MSILFNIQNFYSKDFTLYLIVSKSLVKIDSITDLDNAISDTTNTVYTFNYLNQSTNLNLATNTYYQFALKKNETLTKCVTDIVRIRYYGTTTSGSYTYANFTSNENSNVENNGSVYAGGFKTTSDSGTFQYLNDNTNYGSTNYARAKALTFYIYGNDTVEIPTSEYIKALQNNDLSTLDFHNYEETVTPETSNFEISITNCANGIIYAKRHGITPSDTTIASNESDKSKISIPYDTIFSENTNIYFVFYPNADFTPTERPYGTITYKDSDGNEQSFNLPFFDVTVDISDTQKDVQTYEFDITVNSTRKTFAFGGYGVYYDTSLTSDTYISGIFNILAGEVIPTTTITEYGLFNVYNTTTDELKKLSQNRFKIYSSDYYYEEIDLSGYITSLIEYPFSVKAETELALILGNVALQINSHSVDEYIITVSFEIAINGHYKDNRDKFNSEITLFIPFIDSISIDSNYINTAIKCEYNTDILTNTSVLNVYSNDILIYSTTCIIGYKLPYVYYEQAVNELTDNLRFKNQNCKIQVRQKLNNSDRFSTLKKDTLKNFSGYVRTNEHINIDSSKMMSNELQSIKQLLQGGILINAN